MLRPTGAMRIERHTIPFTKVGENIFEKGDVVFEAKAPSVFKTEHIMITATDMQYPRWYSWLGVLFWVVFPILRRDTVLINHKHHTFTGIRLLWPFRALHRWLTLRHKRRLLGNILVRSVLIDGAQGLLLPIPLLSMMGETTLYTNFPPMRPGTDVKIVLKGEVPAVTVYAVGFAIYGVRL